MTGKTIVVIGATGQQGGSVINAILSSPTLSSSYTVRATTRDPSKPQAQELIKKGINIVPADLNDASSLRRAFTGADMVFANSVTIYDGRTLEHELEHGRAMADAAVACGVSCIIYSTLPHAGNISGGRLKHMGHFDGKAEVEAYIRTLPIRSAFVAPGCFMSNFHESMAPHPDPHSAKEGVYALAMPVPPETKLPLIHTYGDLGKWVAAILEDFDAYEGKVLACATKLYTLTEAVEIISRQSGKEVVYKQVPVDVWKGFLPPLMADPVAEMLQYFYEYGYYGKDTETKVHWSAAQAKGVLTTLEEYLATHPLRL
ncbi:hscarg dehydrogenase [Aspergillus falconensis]